MGQVVGEQLQICSISLIRQRAWQVSFVSSFEHCGASGFPGSLLKTELMRSERSLNGD